MSQIALGVEKFRLNSETIQLDKLFLIGSTIDDEDIEDLDQVAMSRMNSKENDPIDEEYDKIGRIPFMRNVFPVMKQSSKVNDELNSSWKELHNSLKAQLSKIQGLRKALERRTSIISTYKTNLALIKKKRLKQDSAYNYESIHVEIERLEADNKELEAKILKINSDLSEDLSDFSLTNKIKDQLQEFMKKHKTDVAVGLNEILGMNIITHSEASTISSHKRQI